MPDLLAVAMQAGGPVGQIALALLLADRHAQVRPRVDAVDALPALRAEQRDDVVADGQGFDSRADRLDDPGALVAEHRRRVAGRVDARGRVEVRVADAAGDEPHQGLALLRVRQLELLDREWLAELLQYRCTHPHP